MSTKNHSGDKRGGFVPLGDIAGAVDLPNGRALTPEPRPRRCTTSPVSTRSTSSFMEDFRALLSEALPEDRMSFAWNDPTHDPNGMYVVDCRVNGMPRPLFIHALGSDGRARDATITLLQPDHQFALTIDRGLGVVG